MSAFDPVIDSPRTVAPVHTGMRMPESFGCGYDDEVDELIQQVIQSILRRELGLKDNWDKGSPLDSPPTFHFIFPLGCTVQYSVEGR